MDWDIHRIAVSGLYHDGLVTIQTQWSFEDVWEANAVLDALEAAQTRPE